MCPESQAPPQVLFPPRQACGPPTSSPGPRVSQGHFLPPLVQLATSLSSPELWANAFLLAPWEPLSPAQIPCSDAPNSTVKPKSSPRAGTGGDPAPVPADHPVSKPQPGTRTSATTLSGFLPSTPGAAEALTWPCRGRPVVPSAGGWGTWWKGHIPARGSSSTGPGCPLPWLEGPLTPLCSSPLSRSDSVPLASSSCATHFPLEEGAPQRFPVGSVFPGPGRMWPQWTLEAAQRAHLPFPANVAVRYSGNKGAHSWGPWGLLSHLDVVCLPRVDPGLPKLSRPGKSSSAEKDEPFCPQSALWGDHEKQGASPRDPLWEMGGNTLCPGDCPPDSQT